MAHLHIHARPNMAAKRKAVETIHISILSQQVQRADGTPPLAGEGFCFFYFLRCVYAYFHSFNFFKTIVVLTWKLVFVCGYLFRNQQPEHNTFEQPCAGTVTVNLYLTRKIRVDLQYVVHSFCISANLSNNFLVIAS